MAIFTSSSLLLIHLPRSSSIPVMVVVEVFCYHHFWLVSPVFILPIKIPFLSLVHPCVSLFHGLVVMPCTRWDLVVGRSVVRWHRELGGWWRHGEQRCIRRRCPPTSKLLEGSTENVWTSPWLQDNVEMATPWRTCISRIFCHNKIVFFNSRFHFFLLNWAQA